MVVPGGDVPVGADVEGCVDVGGGVGDGGAVVVVVVCVAVGVGGGLMVIIEKK